MAMVMPNEQLHHVAFDTISALSCVGLSAGVITPDMPLVAKYIVTATMFVGRLEFIPVFLFVMAIGNSEAPVKDQNEDDSKKGKKG